MCCMRFAGAGTKLWSNVMEILDEKDGVDTELLVYAMTLINKVSKSFGAFVSLLQYQAVCQLCFLSHGLPSCLPLLGLYLYTLKLD